MLSSTHLLSTRQLHLQGKHASEDGWLPAPELCPVRAIECFCFLSVSRTLQVPTPEWWVRQSTVSWSLLKITHVRPLYKSNKLYLYTSHHLCAGGYFCLRWGVKGFFLQGCPTCGPRAACNRGGLWMWHNTKSWIYLKHYEIFFVIMCCKVFNVWPKTTLLPLWPRDANQHPYI